MSSETAAAPILTRVLSEAKSAQLLGEKFLAVFDLDSTLYDLTLRVTKIAQSFADFDTTQDKYPAECRLLARLDVRPGDWGLAESLNRVGLTETSHPLFFKEILTYWHESFFSNRFLHHDQPLEGAVDFVMALRDLGADLMYLTGRDVVRMRKGTEESLIACGFPLGGPAARLFLKPSANLNDAAFKVAILKEAQASYSQIWLFENEPVNLNLVAKHCPRIGLVFIDTTHSGREKPNHMHPRIAHFGTDLKDFRKRS